MSILFLGLLILDQDVIKIPQNASLASISRIVKFPNGLALLDTVDPKLVTIDLNGNVLNSFMNKGQGPGEWQKPFELRYFDNFFYVTDLLKRRVFVFSEDLKVMNELVVGALCRDVLVTNDAYFFVYWDSKNNSMIHKYSLMMEKITSFGTSLQNQNAMGFQSGKLLIDSGKIYFIHNFIAQIEVYSLDGELIKRITIPGFNSEEFLTFSGMQPSFQFAVVDFFKNSKTLFLKLGDHKAWNGKLYSFRPVIESFGAPATCPFETVSDPNGFGLFAINENQAGDIISLGEITMEEK